MNAIRIKLTFVDGTPSEVIARPHHKSIEGKQLARRMKYRLGLHA